MAAETRKAKLERVRTGLLDARSQRIQIWRDLADNFLPFRGRWLNETPNQKIRRNLKIINETPLIARRTFSAGIMAGVTSPARPWFRLATVNRAILEQEGVREWLYEVEGTMRQFLNASNFYNSLRPCYDEYGTFGTMALGIYEDLERSINCVAYTTGSYYVSNNSKGEVDTFCQEVKWTVRQLVERFVRDPQNPKSSDWSKISNSTTSQWNNKQYEQWVDLVYIVYPNADRIDGAADYRGMPYTACYYEMNSKDEDRLLEEKGYRQFPVMVARLAPSEGEAYGNGLALDCLGSAKALQLQEKRKAQIIDKEVDPPMRGNPALKGQRTSQLPGDVTWVEAGQGQVGFEPLSQWKPDRSGMLEDIASIEARIRQIMFADIFALFIQGEQKDSTATEIAAKQQEKLLMLGPVLEGLNHELLNKAIDRLFSILLRQGAFPEPPDALQGQLLKVEYISILAQAQNIMAVQGINQFTGYVMGLAAAQAQMQTEPTALDKLDLDQAIDEYGNLSGVVPTLIRSDAQVTQLRDARAKQQAAMQQQQQMAEMIPAGAKAAKDLSQAKMGQGSALDAVANG